MRKIVPIVLSVFVFVGFSVSLSSCSVMMPYKEHFECNRGVDSGYCGPIDKVYQKTVEEEQGGQSW